MKLETRGDSKPKITGYAAVFGKRSSDLGSFREVIDRRAFDAHLATNPDVVGLFNHSNDMVLGRTSAGTMRLSVDDYGLRYEIDPPNTSYAKDLMESMKRGDIRSSSFAFFADDEDWDSLRVAIEYERTLKSAERYKQIQRAIRDEGHVDMVLYVTPSFDLVFSLAREFDHPDLPMCFVSSTQLKVNLLETTLSVCVRFHA